MEAAQQMENAPMEQQGQSGIDEEIVNQVAGGAVIDLYTNDETFMAALQTLDSYKDEPDVGIGMIVGQMMAAAFTEAAGQGRLIPAREMSSVAMVLSEAVTHTAFTRGVVDVADESQLGDVAEDSMASAFSVFAENIDINQVPPEERKLYAQMTDELAQMNQFRSETKGQPQQEGDQNV
jgi:hypothetical protein